MFYYLNGKLTLLRPDLAVIDCSGVGYQLLISATTHARLSAKHTILPDGKCDGKEQLLFTHFSVKEDSQELFGFFDEEERDIFRLLITVSGIGPKGALAILSALSPSEIAIACAADDAKAISKANGIGLKTAQKVIIELKDKIAKAVTSTSYGDSVDIDTGEVLTSASAANDAISALVVLGYTKNDAAKAVKAAGNGTVEELIRKSLALLMK
ncbi:MAG: Holliday junction branch migration protein RuvA [Ruminococcaceae bacterium]|nr:Holliday junction branch migration protein RuvA [Oscillospiraceae bacterium]